LRTAEQAQHCPPGSGFEAGVATKGAAPPKCASEPFLHDVYRGLAVAKKYGRADHERAEAVAVDRFDVCSLGATSPSHPNVRRSHRTVSLACVGAMTTACASVRGCPPSGWQWVGLGVMSERERSERRL